jgi:hypothetical protein
MDTLLWIVLMTAIDGLVALVGVTFVLSVKVLLEG